MNNDNYIEEDEVTLKALVLKIKEFWNELLSSWFLVAIITLPFGLWFFYDAYNTPLKYESELVFMINEEKGGGGGGIAALAGQFGFNVGGGGGEYNKEKIISLSKMGMIIHPVILDSMMIGGVNDFVGNHLIRIHELHEKWEGHRDENLKDFLFTQDTILTQNITANTALKACHKLIVGTIEREPITTCGYEEESGILNVSSVSVSDELAYGLTNKVFEQLSSFYIKQQTEPQLKSYEAIKAKADSLNTLIQSKEYELATIKDGTNSVFLRKYKLRENRLQRELPAYASQYASILQNVENADFILKNKTPFFQVIDYPFFPLTEIKESKIKATILGLILGGFLASIFVIVRKIYREVMSEE